MQLFFDGKSNKNGWDGMNKKEVKLYNILLPIWILVFWPSWLWLILIPANYLIDRLVLRWSLGEMPDKGAFCRKHTWKIGFAAGGDHCAVFVLFSVKAVVLSDAPDEIIESRKGYLTSQT